MVSVNEEIKKIIHETPHLPMILENILSHNAVFAKDEEIVDFIFIERQGYVPTDNFFEKKANWQPATLILATSYGISIMEEGGTMIVERVYGYRIKHMLYEKISGIELDICLLSGNLRIFSNAMNASDLCISFNTAKYYKKFEHFVDVVRQKILERSSYK